MIEGIEVLNKVEITKEVLLNWVAPACVTVIVVCFLIGILAAILAKDPIAILAFLFIGVFICVLILGAGSMNSQEVPTGRYRYEVTISDTANFKEIYEKYDVVEQRGDIYVLEEKED